MPSMNERLRARRGRPPCARRGPACSASSSCGSASRRGAGRASRRCRRRSRAASTGRSGSSSCRRSRRTTPRRRRRGPRRRWCAPARKVGVRRLSDFSRTAVYLGRRAEKQGQPDRADRAYDAALTLDDVQSGRDRSRGSPSWRATARSATRSAAFPRRDRGLLSTREARVAILSVARRSGPAAGDRRRRSPGSILSLARAALAARPARPRARPRSAFVRAERAPCRSASSIAGPSALRRVRARVARCSTGARCSVPTRRTASGWSSARGFVALALVAAAARRGSRRRTSEQRSPLFVAAIDLEERREDASAEDGLRQAAAVFPEDSDVWFLLGIYAERSGDLRARAGRLRPRDAGGPGGLPAPPEPRQRAFHRGRLRRGDPRLHRGREEGAPTPRRSSTTSRWPAARPTTSTARPRDRARPGALRLPRQRPGPTRPTLSRVVPAGYSLARARARIARVERPAEEPAPARPRQRPCPGAHCSRPGRCAPLGALLVGVLLARRRRRRGLASRVRALRPRRSATAAAATATRRCTARRARGSFLRKEDADIEEQVAETRAAAERASGAGTRASRIASLLLPGSHAFLGTAPSRARSRSFVFFFGVGGGGHRRAGSSIR